MFREQIFGRIRGGSSLEKFRVGLPEDLDGRIHEALKKLYNEKLIEEFFIFSPKSKFVQSLAPCYHDFFLAGNQKLNFLAESSLAMKAKIIAKLKLRLVQKQRMINEVELETKANSPLYQSLYLLSQGELDCVVAGCEYTTKEVIKAGIDVLGLKENYSTVSSSTLMLREASKGGGGEFTALFSDCGVVMNPSSEQLVEIAEATVETWHASSFLFKEDKPVVSFLSFATHDSAFDSSVQKVREAAESFAKRNPEILSDGPLQFDSAFDLNIRSRKVRSSSLGDQKVNIYIFPDLNSANIAYKLAQRLGGCDSYGPLLQGFRFPYSDLSRGATVDDIVSAVCLMGLS